MWGGERYRSKTAAATASFLSVPSQVMEEGVIKDLQGLTQL